MQRARQLLKSIYGYSSFRGRQEEIIEHALNGGHSFVIMPTGSGKSMCYQLPALLCSGLTLVVSPLIALMEDQVTALKEMGVRAAFLNSTQEFQEAMETERAARRGELDLLYIAPERATTPRFQSLLEDLPLALIAIDEAHCVSQWGHDFRPDYIRLPCLFESRPDVPRMALTATADAATRNDIVERLHLEDARLFLGGYDRPNIHYEIAPRDGGRKQLARFLERHQGESGIIYCLTRNGVERLSAWLREQGHNSLPYHGGMSAEDRRTHQRRFTRETLIMVATLAFGMGIDKPDVRFVVHMELPKSVEAFYQETGRAGRDGLAAEAFMLWGLQDLFLHQSRIDESVAEDAVKRVDRQRLNALLGLCETSRCRRQVLLEYFGEAIEPCGNCDTCQNPVPTWDATEPARMALSAVYRTGQRFGVGYLTELLIGKKTERHLQNFHHDLPTFGVGKEFDSRTWGSIFRQLVAGGFLEQDLAGHGGLRLTPRSAPLLKGEVELSLRREPKRATGRQTPSRGTESFDSVERQLWDALRSKRLELAQAQGVPAYVVAHDRTLSELVAQRPKSVSDLGLISGFGQRKTERYGSAFLEVLLAFEVGNSQLSSSSG